MAKELTVYADKTTLIQAVAKEFLHSVEKQLQAPGEMHIVLTGGSVGIGVLEASAELLERYDIDWYRVHFWWGDERWLPEGDAERNDHQADEALLNGLGLPPENRHAFAAANSGLSLEEAQADFDRELAEWAPAERSAPDFALCFLGVGPDAHIASLFPGLPQIEFTGIGALTVQNSPKPPAERLSMSLGLLNSAERVWLVLAGADKAEALKAAQGAVRALEYPVSAVQGAVETRIFSDRAAAAG